MNVLNRVGCFIQFLAVMFIFGYAIGEEIGVVLTILLAFLIAFLIPQKVLKTFYSRGASSYHSEYFRKIDDKVLAAITKLSWLVMKADKGVSNEELYTFRDYMLQNFGSEATAEAIEIMKYLQYEKVSSQKATHTLNVKLNYAEKVQILQFLFQLAASDGEMHADELSLLEHLAVEMQISQTDFTHLKNAYNYMYNRRYQEQSRSQSNSYSSSVRSSSLDSAYAVLGVKSTDSNQTIKDAYRRLAMANHPDKVQHLGETAHSEAEKRFSKINEAYNRIKKERGL